MKVRERQGGGNRQEQEGDIDSYYKTLVSKHKDMYTTFQYRLWARMNACGLHESMEDSPDVPASSDAIAMLSNGISSVSPCFVHENKHVSRIQGHV